MFSKKSISKQRRTVEQIQVAETRIIKILQNEFFEDEIMKLKSVDAFVNQQDRKSKAQKKSYLKRYSRLYRLGPSLDADGVLRVGGRLRHSSVSDEVKFPIILPKASHITNLIIRYYHERICHQGRGMTLNEIRSNGYWIISGVSAVGSLSLSALHVESCANQVKVKKNGQFSKRSVRTSTTFYILRSRLFRSLVYKGTKESNEEVRGALHMHIVQGHTSRNLCHVGDRFLY